jgi:hypothetical protein
VVSIKRRKVGMTEKKSTGSNFKKKVKKICENLHWFLFILSKKKILIGRRADFKKNES